MVAIGSLIILANILYANLYNFNPTVVGLDVQYSKSMLIWNGTGQYGWFANWE